MRNITLPFKIGCDPEFNVIDPNNHKQQLRIDALSNSRELGADCDGQAEIRPQPSNQIPQLLKNIKKILQRAYKKFGLLDWTTLSVGGSPVGGHIHLEIPENTDFHDKQNLGFHQNEYIRQFTSFYLPLAYAESHVNFAKRRQMSGYGHFTDIRFGEHNTAEIRAPTAEWLTTPKVAYAVLAYCAVIHNEILYHPEHVKTLPFIVKNKKQFSLHEELALQYPATDELNRVMLRKIKKAVKTFELYRPFARAINWLWRPQQVVKEKEKINFDIIAGWELAPARATIPKLCAKTIARRTASQTALIQYLKDNSIKLIHANPDRGVKSFADELERHILANTWKLKHRYVFFGIGANTPILAADDNLNLLNPSPQSFGITPDIAGAFAKMHNRYARPNNEKPTVYIALPKSLRQSGDFMPVFQLINYLEFERQQETEMRQINFQTAIPAEVKYNKINRRQQSEPCPCGMCDPENEQLIFKQGSQTTQGKEPV